MAFEVFECLSHRQFFNRFGRLDLVLSEGINGYSATRLVFTEMKSVNTLLAVMQMAFTVFHGRKVFEENKISSGRIQRKSNLLSWIDI